MKKQEDTISNSLTQIIIDNIYPDIRQKVLESVDGIVEDTTKNITTVVVQEGKKETKKTTTIAHNKFKEILTLVINNIPVMLTGGAGSGKSSTCEKVAKALDLNFYFTNAITQEYKLTGFIDANGKYQETQFYKAFKDGGLFVLDEIDASIPESLIIINTAISNGYFDFPCGKVTAHERFRVIACANTYGLGGNDVYVGRNQLDGASLDRFATVYFDYDPLLEKGLVDNREWVEFIQALRKRLQEKRIKHIVSMRATIYGAKMLNAGVDIKAIFDDIVFKNLSLDDIKSIGTLNMDKNQYAMAFDRLVKS